MSRPGEVGEASGINKLTEDDIRDLRELLAKGTKHRDIAKIYGISVGYVSAIKHGRYWNHVK
jgi:hypothetical protein